MSSEAKLKEVFDQFDTTKDGKIDARELGQVMELLGQHCTDTELLVRHLALISQIRPDLMSMRALVDAGHDR